MDYIEPPFGRELIFGVFPPYFVHTLIIILLIALIFYWVIRAGRANETPLEELKKRYAKGEIDKETFRLMKKDLTQ